MAERAVDLPKPNPDDAEDVVDWLSTARALWARGERTDALVWLRRAAEAAEMCGQPFRASEIGMYITAIEETFGDLPGRAEPPPPKEAERPPQDTLVDAAEAFGQLASEVLRTKMTSIEVDVDEDTLIEAAPAGLLAEGAALAALGPPMVARIAPPGAQPPKPQAAPPPPPPPRGSTKGVDLEGAKRPSSLREAHPPKVIVQVASAAPAAAAPITAPPPTAPPAGGASQPSSPPPSFVQPLVVPRGEDGEETTLVTGKLSAVVAQVLGGTTVPFSAAPASRSSGREASRASAEGARVSDEDARQGRAGRAALSSPPASPTGASSSPPSLGAPLPPPPPTPKGEAFTAFRDRESARAARSSSLPPPPAPMSGSSRPPPAPSAGASSPPPRSPMPSSSGAGTPTSPPPRKLMSRRPASRAPRQPILDPWAEEEVARAKPVPAAPKSGSEEVVVVRTRFPSMPDEDEVFTSAAPLPVTLRRNAPAAPSAAPPPPAPVPRGSAEGGARSSEMERPARAAPASPAAAPQPGRLQNPADVAKKSVPPPTRESAPPAAAAPSPAAAAPSPAAAAAAPAAAAAAPPPASPSAPSAPAPAASSSRVAASLRPAAAAPSAPRSIGASSPSSAASRLVSSPPPARESAPATSPARPGSAPPPAKLPPLSPASVAPASSVASSSNVSPPASSAASSSSASSPAKAAGVQKPVVTAVPRPRPVTLRPPSPSPPPPAPPPPAPPSPPSPAPPSPPSPSPPRAEEIDAARPAAFDPSRATLPMMLEIEPRPVDVPSMRATIPMPMEVPRELEAFFAAQEAQPVLLDGVRLDEVDVLASMPRAAVEELAAKAEIVELASDEEVAGFGGALLLAGSAVLCATIVDAAAHWVKQGELLVARGTLADGIAVRVVGAGEGAKVAVWPRAIMEEVLAAHAPAEVRARAWGDRLQALAGATMGPFGELDDEHRRALAEELSVTCLAPGQIWLEDSAPVPGIVLVGAGAVELYGPISEETSETVDPGSLVFPELALEGGEAPSSVRAGPHGALLLVADRASSQRLSSLVPDLAARLRGA